MTVLAGRVGRVEGIFRDLTTAPTRRSRSTTTRAPIFHAQAGTLLLFLPEEIEPLAGEPSGAPPPSTGRCDVRCDAPFAVIALTAPSARI
jgi:hypothetical protein